MDEADVLGFCGSAHHGGGNFIVGLGIPARFRQCILALRKMGEEETKGSSKSGCAHAYCVRKREDMGVN